MSKKKQLTEREAIAIGRSLAISTKYSKEISNFIRGKTTAKAKRILEDAISLKRAIPMKISASAGHKSGIGPGQYPIKTASAILKILKSAEANANSKGLNVESLIIKSIIPNQASKSYHYGRRRGLKTKATHIEIIVEEVSLGKKKEVKKETPKDTKSTEKKEETKPEPKKEEKVEEKSAEKENKAEEKKTKAPKTESKDSEPQAKPKEDEKKTEDKTEDKK